MYNTIYKIRYICNHENRIICLSYDYILDDCWIFASLPPWRPLSPVQEVAAGGRERRGPLLAPDGDCGAAAVPLLGQVRLLSRDTEEVLAK